jgi:hypothetical protein
VSCKLSARMLTGVKQQPRWPANCLKSVCLTGVTNVRQLKIRTLAACQTGRLLQQSMFDLLPLSKQRDSKHLASEQLVTRLTDECSSCRCAEETCRPWRQQGKRGSTRTFQSDRVAVLMDKHPSRGATCIGDKEDHKNVKNPSRKHCGR